MKHKINEAHILKKLSCVRGYEHISQTSHYPLAKYYYCKQTSKIILSDFRASPSEQYVQISYRKITQSYIFSQYTIELSWVEFSWMSCPDTWNLTKISVVATNGHVTHTATSCVIYYEAEPNQLKRSILDPSTFSKSHLVMTHPSTLLV